MLKGAAGARRLVPVSSSKNIPGFCDRERTDGAAAPQGAQASSSSVQWILSLAIGN